VLVKVIDVLDDGVMELALVEDEHSVQQFPP
jgi:hypothetical protein